MLAVSAALSSLAYAQEAPVDDERARAHYVAGESHFAAERWTDAAREFQQAYALSRRPEMLINLSRAHERAGQLPEAIADLQLLLESYPQTSYRVEAEQRTVVMQAKLDAQPPPALPPVTAAEEPPSAPPPAPEPVRMWPPRWPTLVVGSLAIAAGAAALGTGLRSHALHGDLEERCGDGCPAGFESDRDKGRALSRASTGLMFSSIALAGATAALWVVDYRRDKRMQLGIQGGSAQLRMKF
jgi:tetratricopeptide (TPR) repeat protein